MRLSKRDIERYRGELGDLSEKSRAYVSKALTRYMDANTGATVAEIRDEAKEIIEEALGIYGDQAATMAADFFEEVMEAEGVAVTSTIHDAIDREKMDKKIRYLATSLQVGETAAFAAKAADVTRFYVKRQAYENMVRNCYANNVKYARVPSGTETCSYCFMLCSRGFDYDSEETAKGDSNHGMHNHCDCIIVPGVKGVTEIQGYRPEELQERWNDCRRTCGSGNTEDILRECDTRDTRWLYTGKAPEVEFENEKVRRKVLEETPHELETAKRLSEKGIKCRFVQDYEEYIDEKIGLMQRTGLTDLEGGIELKSLLKATSLGRVDKDLKDAAKKRGLKVCVIDNPRGLLDDDKVVDKASRLLKLRGVPEAIIVRSDGDIVRIKAKK